MANYTYTTRSVTIYRWTLQTPTNGAELDKAWSSATAQWWRLAPDDAGYIPDDALRITAEDDTLVISFTVEEK